MKIVSDKELAAVLALPGPDRYGYFVRSVADWEEIWTLRTSDGFVLLATTEERPLVPVWPHRRFADACAETEWAGAEATSITLEKWLQAWTPGMTNDNRDVAVFPVPSGQGVVVTPDRLKEDLLAERSQYE